MKIKKGTSSTQPETGGMLAPVTTGNNEYFSNAGRAPFEFGSLLLELPDNFSAHLPISRDTALKAAAAGSHASNASDTLMAGIEALGQVLFMIGNSEQNHPDQTTLSDLGLLIKHIAIEAQFLQEIGGTCEAAVRRHNGSTE